MKLYGESQGSGDTVKFDVELPRGRDPVATAQAAEAQGLDGLWTVEAGNDPYLPLALAAHATERIDLGTAIAVAFARSPLVHAQIGWDLNLLAPGRVVVGLGTQVKAHNVRRYSAPFDKPLSRLRDMVRAMRAIWRAWADDADLHYEGEFYTHTFMPPFFRPAPFDGPLPSIYVAAVAHRMLHMAGAEADGVHVHIIHSPRTLDELTVPTIHEGARAAGRDPRAVTLSTTMFVATGRTDGDVAAARERIRERVGFYCSTRSYREVLGVHGWEDRSDALHRLTIEGRWNELAGLVDDEMLDAFSVSGRWDEIAARIVDRYQGRVDRIAPYGQADLDVPWSEVAEEVRHQIRSRSDDGSLPSKP